MIGGILTELHRFLNDDLVTSVPVTDPTRCAIVKIGALQDDPTRTNAWCIVKHDPDKGSIPGWGPDHEYSKILAEIGPQNERWTHNFIVEAGVYCNSLDLVTAYMDILGARVYESLLNNYTLNGIVLAVGTRIHRIIESETTIVTSYTTKITGGERDWFGKVKIAVHYHAETS